MNASDLGTNSRAAADVSAVDVSADPGQGARARLVIHGGAGALPRGELTPALAESCHAALREALEAGGAVLAGGGAALDAVEAAVRQLEDCPLFNAGRGSAFTREGTNEMEAAIMDGATGAAGSAVLLRRVRNPVCLARLIMERTPHVTLGGEAAELWAERQGLALEPPEYFFTRPRYEAMLRLRGTEATALSEDMVMPTAPAPGSAEASGTVGAVAVDARGHLAAASSSGGTTNKYAGRVGQAGLVGVGLFARDATCAVACTGQGEAFMRAVAAYDISALMEHCGLGVERAAEEVVRRRLPGRGGLVALDRDGRFALPYNSDGMYRGWLAADGSVHTAIHDAWTVWPAQRPQQ